MRQGSPVVLLRGIWPLDMFRVSSDFESFFIDKVFLTIVSTKNLTLSLIIMSSCIEVDYNIIKRHVNDVISEL